MSISNETSPATGQEESRLRFWSEQALWLLAVLVSAWALVGNIGWQGFIAPALLAAWRVHEARRYYRAFIAVPEEEA